MNTRKQLLALTSFIFIYALLGFVTVMFFQEAQQAGLPAQNPTTTSNLPNWLFGLINGGIFLILYGVIGLAGL